MIWCQNKVDVWQRSDKLKGGFIVSRNSDIQVSVHMITYNHEPYIRECLESILSQRTDFRFEVVIGEDCSPDNTRAIVLEYQDRYPDIVRVLESTKNLGSNLNAQRVKEACRGKYLAFIEGDDYWNHPRKLQMQYDFLESHPDYGLVCSEHDEFVHSEQRLIPAAQVSAGKGYVTTPTIYDILSNKADILTCTVMAERELVMEVIAADPELYGTRYKMGDTQLWSELVMRKKCHRMPESLATRRIIAESATRSADEIKVTEFWLSNSEMCLYLCEKYQLSQQLKCDIGKLWRRRALKLAVMKADHKLASQVKHDVPDFSFKDHFWYYLSCMPWLSRMAYRMGVVN